MTTATAAHTREPSLRDLPLFLLLTFGLAWGLLGAFLLAPELAARWLGPPSGSHPLFVLAVWAPALAALAVVGRASGGRGVRRFLGRLRLWRAPAAWWAFLLLGFPAVFYAGALMAGAGATDLVPDAGPLELLAAAGFMLVLGPVEEIGWRGVALPLLQRRLSPLGAGVVVGLIWAVWHLPAFLLAGTLQSGWSFTPFLVGTVAASVIMTPMVNAAGGSILLAALFHFQMNNPLWPDARPWDSVLLAGISVVVVVALRDDMLRPGSGVTEVVPPADRPSGSLRSIYARESARQAATRAAGTRPVTEADLERLPDPVRRWLRRIGVAGAPIPRHVHARYRIRIRGAPDDGWMEGTADQHGFLDPPARLFFMTARKGGLPVHVLHRYVGDRATMEGRLLGIIPLFRVEGPEMTRSETVTLLNDLFFIFPAALVEADIEWDVLDERRVRATWTNAGHTVSGVAVFDADDDLVDFESRDRYQMDRTPPLRSRWTTPFRGYRSFDGVRLPEAGEARWGEEGEAWPYVELEVLDVRYEGVREMRSPESARSPHRPRA